MNRQLPIPLPATVQTTNNIGGGGSTYVSCIHIDGMPILPPVMTDKRREEMRHYRDLAIARERELHSKRQQKHIFKHQTPSVPDLSSDDVIVIAAEQSSTPVDSCGNRTLVIPSPPQHECTDYMLVTSMLEQQQRFEMASSMVAACISEPLKPTTGDVSEPAKSSSERTSSPMSSIFDTTVTECVSDMTTDIQTNDADPTDPDDGDGDVSADVDDDECNAYDFDDDLDGDFDESSSVNTTTFVHLVRRTDEPTNNPNETVSIAKSLDKDQTITVVSSTSPRLERSASSQLPTMTCSATETGVGVCETSPRPRLIRSNSYTLESPSPAFLKHLQSHGVELPPKSESSLSQSTIEAPVEHQMIDVRPTNAARRKSFDSLASNKSDPKRSCKPALNKFAIAKAKSASGSGDASTARHRRQSFERIYGARVPVVNVAMPAQANNGPVPVGKLENNIAGKKSKGKALERICRLYDSKAKLPVKPASSVVRPGTETIATAPKPNPTTIVQSADVCVAHAAAELNLVPSQSDRLIELIAQMELDRRRQMDELIARQESEQRRLQEAFMQQQQLLVQQITANCSAMIETCQRNVTEQLARQSPVQPYGTGTVLPNATFAREPEHQTPTPASDESYTKAIPQRRLFIKAPTVDRASSSVVVFSADEAAARDRAATRIQAYVRGYLTRRLFRSEDVQTVVQVIRDTLLFVVDLYREAQTANGQLRPMSESDLKLKRSLLKQLNSSCYMLHDIFIRKSIADRMEIISTDRRIQQKRALREAAATAAINARLKAAASPLSTPRTVIRKRHRMSKLAKITL